MKRLLSVCVIALFWLCFVYSAGAQEIRWQNTIGGTSLDEALSVVPTSDGGFICGGTSVSGISGDKTEASIGVSDYWVIKIDSAGNIQWQQTIGGTSQDEMVSIAAIPGGGYVCGGYSQSGISGDKTEICVGDADYWIVRLDDAGNILWQNTIGGEDEDWLTTVAPVSDKGFICGGYSRSDATGDKTEATLGQTDYWIVKLDSTGSIQWQNTINANSTDLFHSIAQDFDGGYICGGYSNSGISGDKTEANIGNNDFWVLKLDAAGNIVWQNTIGGTLADAMNSIKPVPGGYICGGVSMSDISADKTEKCFGQMDYWIVKLDTSGAIQWQKTIGGDSLDFLYDIVPTADGGYICGGNSKSDVSGNKTESSLNNLDYWVVKIDSVGNIIWQNTIGGFGDEELHAIAVDSTQHVVLAGWSFSAKTKDKSENNLDATLSTSDFWIVSLTDQYNSITGKLFIDLNSNSIQDAGELPVPNFLVTELNTSRFGYTNQQGNYSLYMMDPGNYVVHPNIYGFYQLIPASHPVTFTGIKQTDSLNDFAFQPLGTFNDLWVKMTPMGRFRSGQDAQYIISYANYGTTSLAGDVVFYLDNHLTFVSSDTTPTSVSVDSIVWNTGLLVPFQTGNIILTVHINGGLPVGTLIYPVTRILPIVGDAAPQSNTSVWEILTMASLDPNEMLVSNQTLSTTELAASPYLEYIILFQNTGNDTAFTVKVTNPMDTAHLDLSSLEFTASSHPANMNYNQWENNLEFTFSNILLPDSTTDEPMSHGFARYRIKPKLTLQPGDSITTFAAIYFDFNSAVITNEVLTRIVYDPTFSSLTAFDCDTFISPSGKYSWSATGTYLDTIPNAAGGDSVMTIYLTIGNNASVVSVNDCESYISPSTNYVWNVSGTYTDTISNVAGCDSVITINLTINQSSSSISVGACNSYNSPSGNYSWFNSGIYTDTLLNAAGCDSIITITLTILSADTSVTATPPLLSANASGASYQWIYCDSIVLPGSIGQQYMAASNGSFAVIVTQNGCTDTSSCYVVNNVGITDFGAGGHMIVNPNPAESFVTLSCPQHGIESMAIQVADLYGRTIYENVISNHDPKVFLNVSGYAKGIYFIVCRVGKNVFTAKFMKL